MTVLLLERADPGFRGEVTQWLLEVKAGVYAGTISEAVRERLWKKVQENMRSGAALLIDSAATEQGFQMEMHPIPERKVVDCEGISLIARTVAGTGKQRCFFVNEAFSPGTWG